ncbi:hypothetical protein BDV11DRAFT_173985 [Aspergillus similis]
MGLARQGLCTVCAPFSSRLSVPSCNDLQQIRDLEYVFVDAALQSVKAGFDIVEIHAAHGYLLHQFLSPGSNVGPTSMEAVSKINAVASRDHRLSPGGHSSRDATVRFALVPDWLEGLTDEFHQSWMGIHPEQATSIKSGDGSQAPFALDIERAVGNAMLVSAVGGIWSGEMAERFLQQGLDVVICGRWFQKNSGLVNQFADELGVEVKMSSQYGWALQYGRKTR